MKRWHILDVGSIWLKEFAAALGQMVPVTCWQPEMRRWGAIESWRRIDNYPDPVLAIERFPLQRGYWRFPVKVLAPFAPGLGKRLRAADRDPADSVLVVTTPYYAPVAEQWPGPVVYYQTDFTAAYDGADPGVVRALDARLCRVARAVCPNSARIAEYFVRDTGCDPAKITVVPNATRAANLFAFPPHGPEALPLDVADLPGPVAGVIGNLAANMDWEFLKRTIALTPEFSWLFVGPTTMAVHDTQQRAARERLLSQGGRVRFIGARPYGSLQGYARAFDVAVLPYRKQEPTYSGSSTRFYEHLAACRPMVATEGFAELLGKEPLLRLASGADSAAAALERLRACGFADGFERMRWEASQDGTWERRATAVIEAVTGTPKARDLALAAEGAR